MLIPYFIIIVAKIIKIKTNINFKELILSPTALYPIPIYRYSYIAKTRIKGKMVNMNIETIKVKAVNDFISIKTIIITIKDKVTALIP